MLRNPDTSNKSTPLGEAACFICRHERAVSGASFCMRPDDVRLDVFELLCFGVTGSRGLRP